MALICQDGAFRRELAALLRAAGLVPLIGAQAEAASRLQAKCGGLDDGPKAKAPDLVVLELSAVSGPRAAVVQQYRDRWAVPFLVLADGDDDREEIACWQAGADDYLRPPVRIKPLVARILRWLDRLSPVSELPDRRGSDDRVLAQGALNMDARCHLVTWQGRRVPLTQTEFRVLQALARRPGHVKTREQLLDVAYGDGGDVEDRSIDSHIKRLRKKIRTVDPEFAAIETLYGIGYRYAHPRQS
ncbi:hypothetical protein BV911_08720 [Pseudoruegeria sp. SK021]|nr:hypothetical protein BV911_08720 [Pseudoruegeria sp. SK021]